MGNIIRIAIFFSKTQLRYVETDLEESFKVKVSNFNEVSGLKFENIKFVKGSPVGTNGAITRYPTLDENGKLKNENTFTIICRTLKNKEKGFCISGGSGTIKVVTEQEAVVLAKKFGVSNGKLVSNSFISAINGEYVTAISNTVVEETKKIVKEVQNQMAKPIIEKKEQEPLRQYLLKTAPKNLKSYLLNRSNLELITEWKANIETKGNRQDALDFLKTLNEKLLSEDVVAQIITFGNNRVIRD